MHHEGKKDAKDSDVVYDTLQPCPQNHDVEVEQKPQRQATKSEVSKQLRGVNRFQAGYGLHLDNDRILDNQIEPIATFEPLATIGHRQRDLPLCAHSPKSQFSKKTCFVCRLKQPLTKRAMHVDGRADDAVAEFVDRPLCALLAFVVNHPFRMGHRARIRETLGRKAKRYTAGR